MQTLPLFGLGTFRLKGRTVVDSVSNALDIGYRLIDTAQAYENEADVGNAIRDSGVPREELFITTKIWTDNFPRDRLIPSLKDSLAKLQIEQVDLTLIHWPSPNDDVPLSEYLGALAEAKQQGLTAQIGVSNFTIARMRQAIDLLGAGQIATNQIELHPYLQNRKVVEFAQAQGIHITSYMTLGYGKINDDPVIADIARAYDASPAQVALAWAMQLGYTVIPSSTKRAHLESNYKAQQLRLSDEDLQRIAQLNRGERMIDPKNLAPQWD